MGPEARTMDRKADSKQASDRRTQTSPVQMNDVSRKRLMTPSVEQLILDERWMHESEPQDPERWDGMS